ncbi:FAD-dependent oxidoreductase [Salipiger bermudensis]|uniref:FAD-dependent oxidoreductase n=1 Tax=Salipiger bermudensis TaxID=344736 RepID=UPI001C99832C|nr:FAD-dependent oxidoreductase [Salipiger bermudensis]MBY6005075.1 FAD-dependent oxidoreductase [Salipiger bermudensis]
MSLELATITPEPDRGTSCEALVLGGGIAGLAAADHLSSRGFAVTVLEASERLGGTHRAIEIGPYTYDVGSIFYEETAQLFNLAPGLREQCPQVKRVQRRIIPDGKLRHYPIEPRDLLKWPRLQLAKAVAGMAWARATKRRDGTLEGACVARLGDPFFTGTGLRDYTRRFNGLEPSEIDEEFYDHRMKFIHKATDPGKLVKGAWSALRKKSYRIAPPKPLRIRPRAGYAPLFDAVRETLEARGVVFRMNETVLSMSSSEGATTVVTDKGHLRAEVVVGAIPLSDIHLALFGEESGLETLDLLTLFVSAETLHKEVGNVLFNFHPQGDWKRATIYSNLYPEPATERPFFAVEITLSPGEQARPEQAFADLEAHLGGLGIVTGLRLEGHEVTKAAYPLYRPGRSAELNRVIERVSEAGIVLVGRQGRFEYLPTSTGVIRRVREELGNAADRMKAAARP